MDDLEGQRILGLINAAEKVEDLEGLSLTWRQRHTLFSHLTEHGPVSSLNDLLIVEGIGNKTLVKMEQRIHRPIEWLVHFFERFLQLQEELTKDIQRTGATDFCNACPYRDKCARVLPPVVPSKNHSGYRIRCPHLLNTYVLYPHAAKALGTKRVRCRTWSSVSNPFLYTVYFGRRSVVLIQESPRAPGVTRIDAYRDSFKTAREFNPVAIGFLGEKPGALRCRRLTPNVVWCNGQGVKVLPLKEELGRPLLQVVSTISDSLISRLKGPSTPHKVQIEAMCALGEELGYSSVQEFRTAIGVVDCVWLSAHEEVFAAIEVETGSEVKKDIVSIWETRPKVGIILHHCKSEHDLLYTTKLEILNHIPFPLVFVAFGLQEVLVISNGDLLDRLPLRKCS